MRLVGGCVQPESGDKIIPIVERGEAIRTLHSILVDLSARFPDNNVLGKWIIDITLGTEKVFKYPSRTGTTQPHSCLFRHF